jgi:hypothetical protein
MDGSRVKQTRTRIARSPAMRESAWSLLPLSGRANVAGRAERYQSASKLDALHTLREAGSMAANLPPSHRSWKRDEL